MDFGHITDTLFSLITLTFLEIVLGVDNLIFISIASSRLPLHKQKMARRIGLLFALGTRLLLLASVVWIVGLKHPLFTLFGLDFSPRDLFLILGGAFLIFKATLEIHAEFESHSNPTLGKKFASFSAVVTQIAILDIVFSLDSILTAIGMTQNFIIMAIAITIAVILMMISSEPLSRFVQKNPTIRMLALSFLLLIGMVLIADGLHNHIPKGYIYFAVCYSVLVEILNSRLAKRRAKAKLKKAVKH